MLSLQKIDSYNALEHKLPWEAPRFIVERNLVARAQDGDGGSDETWALQRLLGPMNVSGDDCIN